jgi:hypothetical protein
MRQTVAALDVWSAEAWRRFGFLDAHTYPPEASPLQSKHPKRRQASALQKMTEFVSQTNGQSSMKSLQWC